MINERFKIRKNRLIKSHADKGMISYSEILSYNLPYIDETTCNNFYAELKDNGIKIVDDGKVNFNNLINNRYMQGLKNDFFDYIDDINEWLNLKTNRNIEIDDYFDNEYIYTSFYIPDLDKNEILDKILYRESNQAKDYRKYKNKIINNSLNLLYETAIKTWEKKDLTLDFNDGENPENVDLFWREIQETTAKFQEALMILESKAYEIIKFDTKQYELSHFILENIAHIFNLFLEYPNNFTNICIFEMNYIILYSKSVWYEFVKINSFQKYIFNIARGCFIKSNLHVQKRMNDDYDKYAIIFAKHWDDIYQAYLDKKDYNTVVDYIINKNKKEQ